VWGEVAAVSAVGVVPYISSTVSILAVPPTAPLPYWVDALTLTVGNGCAIFVTLYLIARSGESWSAFGLVPPRLSDVLLGGLMLMVAHLAWALTPQLPDLGVRAYPFPRPNGAGDQVLMVVKFAVGAFSEELVTRAYLITRLTLLLRSRGEAVVIAAVLFAIGHGYQGPTAVAYTFVFGVWYGIVFLVMRRVWPLALGHAFYNVLGDLSVV
jgi:membrane protease YdiL (CAAX protease family)